MKKSVYMLTVLLTGGELHVSIRTIPEVLNCAQAQFYTGSLVLVLEALADRPLSTGIWNLRMSFGPSGLLQACRLRHRQEPWGA